MDQLCLLPRCVSTTSSQKIVKGSIVLFFFPHFTVSFSSHSHALSLIFFSFSFLFPFLSLFPFFFFSFSSYSFLFFFSSFFSFSPYPSIFFLFPLSGRKLPLTLLFICHVSFFPWSMCHMDICSRWHFSHHMALMSCVLLSWCHVASSHVSPNTRYLEKHEIPTISGFNEIRLGN